MPPDPMLREFPAAARCSITKGPQTATRRLAGEIRAFSPSELGSTLEAALRFVTAVAALTEAVLEVGAVRTAPPRVASPRAVEELARDLWSAGYPVRFGPSWEPVAAADVYVGIGDGELQGFLRSHPLWSVT